MTAQDPPGSSTGLPPAFIELERRLSALQDQFRRGELTEQVYQAAVQALTVQDPLGNTWWLAGESGVWQFWDGHRWVQSDPSVLSAAVPPAASPQDRRWRPIAMGCGVGAVLVAVVLGGLLLGGWREYQQMPKVVEGIEPALASASLVDLSSEQLRVSTEMGPPQAFTIYFYEEELVDGTFGEVRYETWDYYDRGVEYTFINGEIVAEEPLELEIVGGIHPIPYRPDQFHAYMSLEEVLASAGIERYLVVPLEKELVAGGEVYYAGELTFGLKDGELLYIEALAVEVEG